jgi:hypothetical protein
MVKRVDFDALMRRCQKAEAELERLRNPSRHPVKPPASPPRPAPPLTQPAYSLRFPLGREQWISVESNKPLEPRHWDRLTQILDMQRECLSALEYVALIPDECGEAA